MAQPIAQLLIESGANPETRFQGDGETVLHRAASSSADSAIIEVLLDHGAEIDAPGGVIRGGTPLMNSVYFGFEDVAALLAKRGAAVHNIIAAAGLGRLDLIEAWYRPTGQYLQEATRISHSATYAPGALLSEQDAAHWSYNAVIAALSCRQYATVDWFLAHGFDIDRIPEGVEWSCLHHAAYAGSLPMAMYLVAKGADVNVRTSYDVTPAGFGAGHGHPHVMNYLIDQGMSLSLDYAANLGRLDRLIPQLTPATDLAPLLACTIGVTTAIGKPIHPELRQGAPRRGTLSPAARSGCEIAARRGSNCPRTSPNTRRSCLRGARLFQLRGAGAAKRASRELADGRSQA